LPVLTCILTPLLFFKVILTAAPPIQKD